MRIFKWAAYIFDLRLINFSICTGQVPYRINDIHFCFLFFYHSVDYVFTFSVVSFCRPRVVTFEEVQFIFVFIVGGFDTCKKPVPNAESQRGFVWFFFLMFSCKIFIVLALMFYSIIHFNLISPSDMQKQWPKFILLHGIDTQCPKTICWKNCSSPIERLWPPS